MFDITATFETTFRIKLVDKGFEEILSMCGDRASVPYKIGTIKHEVDIKNSPVIPNEEWIEATRKIIFEEVTKSFSKETSLNIEPIETKFIGFTKITQK